MILPLSGEFAVLGEVCRKGVELAASNLRSEGLEVSLFVQDSPSASAKTTLTAFHKLRSVDQIEAFLGFVSPEELAAVGPIADREGAALVAFNASQAKPKNSLLVWMSPRVEARRFANVVFRSHKKVAILSANQEWEGLVSDAFTEEFEGLGGEIVLRIDSPYSSKDVRSAALKVRQTSAEAVLIPPYSLFSAYARALRNVGSKLPIYAVELDQSAIDETKGAAEGTVMIRPADPEGAFMERYSKFYSGLLPEIPASQCYDGMKILGAAAKKGARSGVEFVKFFEELKEYSGTAGTIQFQGDETVADTEILQVIKGKFSKIS